MNEYFDTYFPAIAELQSRFIAANKEVKYMLHLVAYDIANPKRLRKVAKVCLDYGIRVEYSVFECDLPASVFEKMWDELNQVINPEEDALLAYTLCQSCVNRTIVAGTAVRPEKQTAFIV